MLMLARLSQLEAIEVDKSLGFSVGGRAQECRTRHTPPLAYARGSVKPIVDLKLEGGTAAERPHTLAGENQIRI
jgi:hypothetical protein